MAAVPHLPPPATAQTEAPAPAARARAWLWPIARALAFRYACYALMMVAALWAEGRPAPHLPDLLIDRVPYLDWVDRGNYWLLTLAYLPVALVLLWIAPARFCRYNVTSGLLSLCRGACIALTGLGPVRGPDVHAGRFLTAGGDFDWGRYLHGLYELLVPLGFLLTGPDRVYLTKDLFFSGHTGVTFLLLLYAWPYPRLRAAMLAGHVLVVASVVLAHLHYTIDIAGAYAVAFALFALREGWPPRVIGGTVPGPPR